MKPVRAQSSDRDRRLRAGRQDQTYRATRPFAEVFTLILNSGPNLVQRALGRRAPGGPDSLQRLLLEHAQDTRISKLERSALLSAWMHALWKPGVPDAGRAALDAAV
ncbi:jg379, partial [Pararge aegeria aegeria]